MNSNDQSGEWDSIFRILSNETRRQLLEVLLQKDSVRLEKAIDDIHDDADNSEQYSSLSQKINVQLQHNHLPIMDEIVQYDKDNEIISLADNKQVERIETIVETIDEK